MTDREKLVYLIKENAKAIVSSTENGLRVCLDVETLVDHLLSHGVTVRGAQKPLTVEEAAGTNMPVWYEHCRRPSVIPVDVVYSHSTPFLEICRLGATSVTHMREDSYGKTWRCWAEKPTNAERRNTKWEE